MNLETIFVDIKAFIQTGQKIFQKTLLDKLVSSILSNINTFMPAE